MTIGEVINLLIEIFKFLSEYLGGLFGNKGEDTEAPEGEETPVA